MGDNERLRLDTGRARYWISQGAKPSETVNSLLKQAAAAAATPAEGDTEQAGAASGES